MPDLSRSSGLPLWAIFVLLPLAIRAPAEASPTARAQPGTARGPGAADRSDVAVRKPAWKWTLEERLAARFDPEAIAAREAGSEAEQKPILKHWRNGLLVKEDTETTGPTLVTEMIDGSKTPELFLPGELFDMLLSHVSLSRKGSEDLQASRSSFEEWLAALGFGRDFLERFEETTASYLRLLQDEDRQDRTTGLDAVKGEKENKLRVCRARAQALEAAEAEFGEDAFLRLLYEGIAPYARKASLYSSDYRRKAEELRFQEGGCR